MEDIIWTTKEGEKIAIADMSESHAKNVLRLVIRRNDRLAKALEEERSWSNHQHKKLSRKHSF